MTVRHQGDYRARHCPRRAGRWAFKASDQSSAQWILNINTRASSLWGKTCRIHQDIAKRKLHFHMSEDTHLSSSHLTSTRVGTERSCWGHQLCFLPLPLFKEFSYQTREKEGRLRQKWLLNTTVTESYIKAVYRNYTVHLMSLIGFLRSNMLVLVFYML